METGKDTVRILLVDDHQIVRDGIMSLLSDVPRYDFVGQAENGQQAIGQIEQLSPDLVILDINMPVMDGLTCMRIIAQNFPEVKVLALTMLNEQDHIRNMIAAGAGGYILKNSGKEELIAAIDTVMAGRNYFSDEVKDQIMMGMVKKKSTTPKIAGEPVPLTPRELDVLRLIIQEHTNQEIAEKLFISVRTVDAHRRNLLEKTGARNTAGLVKYALENKLFNGEE